MRQSIRRNIGLLAVAALALGLVAAAPEGAGGAGYRSRDIARYVLPPGNYGGLPTTDESRDQLALYDGLTPKRDAVTDADIEAHYLPQDFEPVGPTTEVDTGRPGVRILYDQYGVAHVYGRTRADVAFGAGWVTLRDRQLLLQLGRGPARAAVADVPGIDAFSLVTSGQSFVPSAQSEALLDEQVELIKKTYGAKGRQIIRDAQAHADGMNAYAAATGLNWAPATVNDVIAVTAFIGSIFGSGGGGEARNAELLAQLQAGLGPDTGRAAWEDAMLFDDPEAPTTIKETYDYGPLTGGPVTGSAVIDPGSIVPLDPRQGPAPADAAIVDAASAPPARQASNFLLVDPQRSATGNSLGVMGPQLGYYYPEIVQQIHLKGPGFEAQGAAVPGMAMYMLIGRTHDYAWSLTSAGSDVRDVFAEKLCEPGGGTPTRDSDHYLHDGQCRPFVQFDAGTLNGTPIRYPKSVHGPVIGTATVDGQPVALTRQRSTFGRDGLNLAALKDMTDGKANTAPRFFDAANRFGFTFNWAYTSRFNGIAFFSSGLLPQRSPGLDRRLPTWGTGEYEWQGFLTEAEHPRSTDAPNGLFLNWNNQAAPGYMHGDDSPFGSVQRLEVFDQWPSQVTLADTVGVMNRAATEDVRSPVWPVVSQVLQTGSAPSPAAAQAVAVLDEWVARDAPRLDADNNGRNDDAGAVIMDAVWRPIAEAVMRPVFGSLLDELNSVRNLSGPAGHSFVDKDLRTLLDPSSVTGPFELAYCGNGSLDTCRADLWAAIDQAIAPLVLAQGADPAAWRGNASRTTFVPGLIPDTIRATNRPTYQQVLELASTKP